MKTNHAAVCALEPDVSGGRIQRWWWRCAGARAIMLPNAAVAALADAVPFGGTGERRLSAPPQPVVLAALRGAGMIEGEGLLTDEALALAAMYRLLAMRRGCTPYRLGGARKAA